MQKLRRNQHKLRRLRRKSVQGETAARPRYVRHPGLEGERDGISGRRLMSDNLFPLQDLNLDLGFCANKNSSSKAVELAKNYLIEILQKLPVSGCLTPCSSDVFRTVLKYFHE